MDYFLFVLGMTLFMAFFLLLILYGGTMTPTEGSVPVLGKPVRRCFLFNHAFLSFQQGWVFSWRSSF